MEYFVYFREKGVDRNFKPFDLNNGNTVGNILYAPMYAETALPTIKSFMQQVVSMQSNIQFQLRPTGNRRKVVWSVGGER